MARYEVTKLYREDGGVSPHYVNDEFLALFDTWEQAMAHPRFASVIERDLQAEQRADGPLDHLAAFAPNERVKSMYLAWLSFIDDDLDPWTTGGAIHFRPHWARVLMHALVIADQIDLPDIDLRCLAMAAAFHDSRRKSPYMDIGHGVRAARYYRTFSADTAQCNSQAGKSMRFDPRAFETVKWHDRDDEDGIHAINEVFSRAWAQDADLGEAAIQIPEGASASPELVYSIFKDADAVDRVRLGKGQLDLTYLRVEPSKRLVAFAEELVAACE